jgi:hypothetical protein
LPIIQGVSGGIVNILGGGSMDYSEYIYIYNQNIYIQGVSGGIVNILGDGNMDYSH